MSGDHVPVVETRCSPNGACIEVTARTRAGQQAIHETSCPEEGYKLLETAQRIAELHGYGMKQEGS